MKQLLAVLLSALMTTPAVAQMGPAVADALQTPARSDKPLKPRLTKISALNFPQRGGGGGGGWHPAPPSRPSGGNGGGGWHPAPQPPRQQPPRQQPPRQQPPRQQPPRQEPPRRNPPPQQPPRRNPPPQQPPRRNPPPQQPPRRNPPPQQPPRRNPPPQQPPRRDPPPQQPPRRNPPPQQPPRREPPHGEPPRNVPPVITHPQPQPGRPGRVEPPRRPDPIKDPNRVMDPARHGDHIDHPRQFPDGRPINARPVDRGPHGNNVTIINNTTVINNVNVYNRTEVYRGRYYWHEWDGYHYCHYYDTWGFHWYGWYIGDVYFWTRYWNDTYWWYDPYWGRWVYMRDGRWWWQDPYNVTVVYIYVPESNNYYRYDNAPGGGVVMTPDPTPPVNTPPAEPSQPAEPQAQKIFLSPDGRRSVQVFGDTNDAFLYDTGDETPAFNPVFLASNVTEARFSQSAEGQPLQLLLLTETTADDGTVAKGFRMFDENGNDLSQAAQPTPTPVQPPSGSPDDHPAPSSFSQSLNALRAGSLRW